MENLKEENIDTIPMNDDAERNENLDEIEVPEEVPQVEEVAEQPTEQRPRTRLILKGSCPICWVDLNTNPLGSTVCGHVFCYDCIEKAMEVCDTCPTCRHPLEGSSSFHPLFLRTI